MNKPKLKREFLYGLMLVLACSFFSGIQAVGQDFGSYQNYKEFTENLKKLSKSEFLSMESIGKSIEGRDIWLMTLGKKNNLPLDNRQAILLTANLEGEMVFGSQLCAQNLKNLIDRAGEDQVQELLENHVLYFIPRLNPDGAERMFDDVKSGFGTNMRETDRDNDGRMNEDGPDDLNNDGLISFMRVKDPEGSYCLNPDLDFLLKKADPLKKEEGIYKLYFEGLDNDGDGFINEDPVGGVDVNRNFQHEYPYYQADAGPHMISENESRALIEFVISHRNIALAMTYGLSDNLIVPADRKGNIQSDNPFVMLNYAKASNDKADETGYFTKSRRSFYRYGSFSRNNQSDARSGRSFSRKAATSLNPKDMKLYSMIGDEYKKLTGIKERVMVRKPEGDFSQYAYYQYGIPSFISNGWGINEADEEKSEKPQGRFQGKKESKSFDVKMHEWLMKNNPDAIVDWKEYNHPDLGQVDIGGYNMYALFNPPARMISENADHESDFILYLGTLFAKASISDFTVNAQGDGFYILKASVRNNGFMPLAIQQGLVSRAVKPALLKLHVDPEQIISGKGVNNFIQNLEGSGGIQSFEWLIKGKKGQEISLSLSTQKAGIDSKSIQLN